MAWYRSRYVQHLEAEVARLKDENRRLLNIMLPRLGYNPLDPPEPKDLSKQPRKKLSWHQWGQKRAAAIAREPREILIRDPKPLEEKPSGDTAAPSSKASA